VIERAVITGHGYRRRREHYEWAFAAGLWELKVRRRDRAWEAA
jgi:hypothetical protein